MDITEVGGWRRSGHRRMRRKGLEGPVAQSSRSPPIDPLEIHDRLVESCGDAGISVQSLADPSGASMLIFPDGEVIDFDGEEWHFRDRRP
jgi:hypothetical protein